jgi:hypothetical protein
MAGRVVYYGGIAKEGLVLNLDAAKRASYPGTGNTWIDTSGYNNHATMFNGLTYNSSGWMEFDGVDDYCTIPYNAAVMDSWKTEQTVAIWTYHTTTIGRRNPWNQAYGGYGTWTLELGDSMNYYYGNAGIDNNPYTSINSNPISRGVWNYLTITRNTSTVTWYVNGVVIRSNANLYGVLTTTAQPITIGDGYVDNWLGRMSVIQAYNRALTSAEVLQNYNALKGRYGL